MTILITGANRGIGAELVRQYAKQDQQIIATTRKDVPSDLADLAEWQLLDVTDQASFDALKANLGSREISLLICNAGVFLDRPDRLADGFSPEQWRGTFDANVMGPFLTVQNLLPNLQAHGAAKVAIIASKMGSSTHTTGGAYAYRASKAAAINLSTSLACDLGGQGISVGAYHPGWVRTDMGTAKGEIDTTTSAIGLIARFAALSPETSGCFQSYSGETLPF
jgi:NAD(P)-dependent dehydrogenase (short-subunit alcohol dehydrogenase family)